MEGLQKVDTRGHLGGAGKEGDGRAGGGKKAENSGRRSKLVLDGVNDGQ